MNNILEILSSKFDFSWEKKKILWYWQKALNLVTGELEAGVRFEIEFKK